MPPESILSAARWATGLQIVGQAISWLSTIFVVRFLTQSDFGVYAMIETPLELCLMLAILGLDVALVQSRTVERAAVRSAFGALLLLGACFFCIFFFGAHLLAAHFREGRLEASSQAMSFVFLVMPFRVIPNAILDRNLQFKSRAKLELIAKVIAALSSLIFAVAGFGQWALIISFLAERILYALLVAIRHPWLEWPTLRLQDAKDLFVFGGLIEASSAVQLIASKGVSLIIAPILGAAQMGVYALGTQFALLPLSKVMPIVNRVLIPSFALLAQDPAAASNSLERTIRIGALILAPFMFGMAALADPFVAVVFGTTWGPAAIPLALMSCLMPMRMATLLTRSALTSMGHPRLVLVSTLVPFLLALPFCSFAARGGSTAVIWMWMLIEPVTFLITGYLAGKVMPFAIGKMISSLLPAIITCLFLVVAATLTAFALSGEAQLVRLISGALVGAIAFLASAFAFYRSTLIAAVNLFLGR